MFWGETVRPLLQSILLLRFHFCFPSLSEKAKETGKGEACKTSFQQGRGEGEINKMQCVRVIEISSGN